MKRVLAVLISLVAVFSLIGCDSEEKQEKKATENLKKGYNFIQPKVNLGTARGDVPDGIIIENTSDSNTANGESIEYKGVTYDPYFSWMGTEKLSLIEYMSREKVTEGQYYELLAEMKKQYGSTTHALEEINGVNEVDSVVVISAEETPSATATQPAGTPAASPNAAQTETAANGTATPTAETSPTAETAPQSTSPSDAATESTQPSDTATQGTPTDNTAAQGTPASATATQSTQPAETPQSAQPSATASSSTPPTSMPDTITPPPTTAANGDDPFPPVSWEYENVNISLFYMNGQVIISMVMN